ncbi:hypothetical protein [Photobacterium phosphoreum]|uniref:hypothetical protein n=1 Tax=Photobacterium phosphoreum TaxID=659 RepID=UPI001E649A2C|nr:hypothetical protein [Photobacterium phosphoreum]MCD9521062.1 hypothetical protein [Photobacterium phosphoreum]
MAMIKYPNSIKDQANALSISIDTQITAIDSALSRINVASPLDKKVTVSDVTSQYLCLHPYLFGVDHNDTLSAPAALQRAGNIIMKSPYHLSNGLALIVTGRNPSHFAQQIQDISTVITHPAWVQLAILATKKALLPIEKMQIPKTTTDPSWVSFRLDFMSPILDCRTVLGHSTKSKPITPIERLIQVSQHQKDRLAQQKQGLLQLKSAFTGQCSALRLTGTHSAMKRQLTDANVDNQPYATVLILLSNDINNLSIYYEMFDL